MRGKWRLRTCGRSHLCPGTSSACGGTGLSFRLLPRRPALLLPGRRGPHSAPVRVRDAACPHTAHGQMSRPSRTHCCQVPLLVNEMQSLASRREREVAGEGPGWLGRDGITTNTKHTQARTQAPTHAHTHVTDTGTHARTHPRTGMVTHSQGHTHRGTAPHSQPGQVGIDGAQAPPTLGPDRPRVT